MTITAKFSNGHTDTYKGNRPVKAAWMITCRETGKVLASGHSLDVAKARKTAEGSVADCVRVDYEKFPSFYLTRTFQTMNPAYAKEVMQFVRRTGLADGIEQGKLTAKKAYELAKAANGRRAAEQASRAVIEVIAL